MAAARGGSKHLGSGQPEEMATFSGGSGGKSAAMKALWWRKYGGEEKIES